MSSGGFIFADILMWMEFVAVVPCYQARAPRKMPGCGPVSYLTAPAVKEPRPPVRISIAALIPLFRPSPQRARLPVPILSPPVFEPSKLRVNYTAGSSWREPPPHRGRSYTLTHNDLTGQLVLTVGSSYNHEQIGGWYTKLVRDEVLAEVRHSPAFEPRSRRSPRRDPEGYQQAPGGVMRRG